MNKINIKNIAVFLIISLIAGACKTSFDDIKYSDGNADFSRFVAIGSSYFAGYSDKALYYESQSASIPLILSSRFSFVGGGAFLQPLVKPGVGIGLDSNSKYVLKLVASPCLGISNLVAQPIAATGDASNFNWLGNALHYNNFSVPFTRIKDVTSQDYGNPSPFLGNPFYSRFANNPATSTITGDALLTNPTFVAIWMGIDDVLRYAATGGNQGGDSITTASYFNTLYTNLVSEMTAQNESGVLLNIPSLNSIPFFTAVKWNGLTLDAARATQLTALYSGVNNAITFIPGNNPYVIADANQASGFRQIHSNEYILLSVARDSINCYGWGTTVPIPEKYVLTDNEVVAINNAINAFNNTIFTQAANKGLAYADINSLFKSLESGIKFNGLNFTIDYLNGGAFSTDGYNLSQRGAAIISNEVLNAINRQYRSKIPLVDVNSYPGVSFP